MSASPIDTCTAVSSHVALDSYHTTLAGLRGVPTDDPTVQALLEDLRQAVERDLLDREAPFMRYRGRSLKRDKAFYVDSPTVTVDGEPQQLFLYRYPGFQHESMRHYRAVGSVPVLERLLRELAECHTFRGQSLRFNHVIATRYRDGDDAIGWHCDKMQDIVPGSPILSLSLGAERDLQLRPVAVSAPDTDDDATTITPVITTQTLRHGDLFVLGPETNRQMQHCVPPLPPRASSQPPQARISLVFRHIQTEVTGAAMIAAADRSSVQRQARKRARDEAAPC
jgi:alkylated DNA repair dioxygenase AlkB